MKGSEYINEVIYLIPVGHAIYFTITGFLWCIFYGGAKLNLFTMAGKLQPSARYNVTTMLQEIKWSSLTIIVGCFFMAVFTLSFKNGKTMLYDNIDQYGWGYYLFSVVLIWVFNDAWMYWTHRFLHHPWAFAHIHKVHHRFFAPTPFSTMAFHPAEAAVQFLPVPLAKFVPLHTNTFMCFMVILLLISITEHLGYRIGIYEKISAVISTPIHHDLHHALYRCNYGVYFTFWDRAMGTYVPESLDEIKKQRLIKEQGGIHEE